MTLNIPFEVRFWRNVDKQDDSACWNWIRSTLRGGYGKTERKRGKAFSAHRAAWELTYGPIPKGMLVLHHCDNPRCVNPKHLWLGTQKDNVHDAFSKGRRHGRPGESNPIHKLTEQEVLEIRDSALSQCALAGMHGVSPSLISRIQHGERWCFLSH